MAIGAGQARLDDFRVLEAGQRGTGRGGCGSGSTHSAGERTAQRGELVRLHRLHGLGRRSRRRCGFGHHRVGAPPVHGRDGDAVPRSGGGADQLLDFGELHEVAVELAGQFHHDDELASPRVGGQHLELEAARQHAHAHHGLAHHGVEQFAQSGALVLERGATGARALWGSRRGGGRVMALLLRVGDPVEQGHTGILRRPDAPSP